MVRRSVQKNASRFALWLASTLEVLAGCDTIIYSAQDYHSPKVMLVVADDMSPEEDGGAGGDGRAASGSNMSMQRESSNGTQHYMGATRRLEEQDDNWDGGFMHELYNSKQSATCVPNELGIVRRRVYVVELCVSATGRSGSCAIGMGHCVQGLHERSHCSSLARHPPI